MRKNTELNDNEILKTRSLLVRIIEEDKKFIPNNQQKLKTVETFRRVWESREEGDSAELRKNTVLMLRDFTVRMMNG
jgi:hypothetical protein